MASLIGFLFNLSNIQKELNIIWCGILDDLYVKEKMIDPLIHHISNGNQLELDLIRTVQKGMEISKSNQSNTKPEPFLLTVSKPKKVLPPTFTVNKPIKPSEIPKNLFETPKAFIKLEKLKEEHKAKSIVFK
jgi:hypothetical protein